MPSYYYDTQDTYNHLLNEMWEQGYPSVDDDGKLRLQVTDKHGYVLRSPIGSLIRPNEYTPDLESRPIWTLFKDPTLTNVRKHNPRIVIAFELIHNELTRTALYTYNNAGDKLRDLAGSLGVYFEPAITFGSKRKFYLQGLYPDDPNFNNGRSPRTATRARIGATGPSGPLSANIPELDPQESLPLVNLEYIEQLIAELTGDGDDPEPRSPMGFYADCTCDQCQLYLAQRDNWLGRQRVREQRAELDQPRERNNSPALARAALNECLARYRADMALWAELERRHGPRESYQVAVMPEFPITHVLDDGIEATVQYQPRTITRPRLQGVIHSLRHSDLRDTHEASVAVEGVPGLHTFPIYFQDFWNRGNMIGACVQIEEVDGAMHARARRW